MAAAQVDKDNGFFRAPNALLDYAFGQAMIEGEGEWSKVDHIVRTSLLLLYKELRKQDLFLRNVEQIHDAWREEQLHSIQRWDLLQTQIKLFQDELQHLTSDLRDVRKKQLLLAKNTAKEIEIQLKKQQHIKEVEMERRKNEIKDEEIQGHRGYCPHHTQELETIISRLERDHRHRQDAFEQQLQSHRRKIHRLKERIRRNETRYEPSPEIQPVDDLSKKPDAVSTVPPPPPAASEELPLVQEDLKEIHRIQEALEAHDVKVCQSTEEIKEKVAHLEQLLLALTGHKVSEKEVLPEPEPPVVSSAPVTSAQTEESIISSFYRQVLQENNEPEQVKKQEREIMKSSRSTASSSTHLGLRKRFERERQLQKKKLEDFKNKHNNSSRQ